MGNPFDEVINVEDKKSSSSSSSPSSSGSRRRKDTVQVSFSLNTRWIERGLFLIIIIALLALYLTKPTGPVAETITTPAVEATSPTPDTSQDAAELAQEEEAPVEEPVEETPPPEEEEVDTTPSDPETVDFTATIDADYTEVSGRPTLMKSVTVEIFNKGMNIRPTIKLYWYDADSTDEVKNRVRGTESPFMIATSQRLDVVFDTFEYKLIEQGEPEETIKAVIIDRDSGEVLKTVTKTIS